MPTQRKRIGFLPRMEVQNIIDKICDQNKLSQSKVTGMLVEEALSSRGVLNTSSPKLSLDFSHNDSEALLTANNIFNNEMHNDNLNLEDSYEKYQVQMINDFIEFKFFKNIMEKKKQK